jgi:hypothetical protein
LGLRVRAGLRVRVGVRVRVRALRLHLAGQLAQHVNLGAA